MKLTKKTVNLQRCIFNLALHEARKRQDKLFVQEIQQFVDRFELAAKIEPESVQVHFIPITKQTRCGVNGKPILCPNCDDIFRVYNFAWTALACTSCEEMAEKHRFYVMDTR